MANARIEVISIEDGEDYCDSENDFSTVNVVLRRGNELASCEGIAIWEEECADEHTFNEWVRYAAAGEEGYRHWTV